MPIDIQSALLAGAVAMVVAFVGARVVATGRPGAKLDAAAQATGAETAACSVEPRKDQTVSRLPLGVIALIGASILVSSITCEAVAETLIEPKMLIVDSSLPNATRDAEILAARRYDTFWNTGDAAFAEQALSKDFVDETPPPGRAPGPKGPLAASRVFRAAVPDLTCTVEQMIVSGDRVVTHLRFQGHFTGTFQGRHGKGEKVNFIATDIYRVVDGRIAANWHIEDNLTLLRQLGVVKSQ